MRRQAHPHFHRIMGRTRYYPSRLPFIVDQHSLDRNHGRQIDWTGVDDSLKDATTGRKRIKAGTLLSKRGGKGIPRAGAKAEQELTSITRAGAVATATLADHGLVTGDTVVISGATQAEYNITATITVASSSTFTFAVTGTPATPATGTILATLPADCILLADAVENDLNASLSGQGVIVGGVLYKNLLPDAGDADFETFLAELQARSTGFRFETYANSI